MDCNNLTSYMEYFRTELKPKFKQELFESDIDFVKIIYSQHSLERMGERYKNIKIQNKINKFLKQVISVIINKHKGLDGFYGIHSNSLNIGGIVNFKKKKLIVVTLLPFKKQHYFNNVNDEIIIENIINEVFPNINKNSIDTITFKHIKDFFVVFQNNKLIDNNIQELILL